MSIHLVLPVDGGHTSVPALPGHETLLSVCEGVVYLVAGDDETVLTPGDAVILPAGVDFSYWNAGDDEARVRQATRPAGPALRAEELRRAA